MAAIREHYANRPRSSDPWVDARVRGVRMVMRRLPSRSGNGVNGQF